MKNRHYFSILVLTLLGTACNQVVAQASPHTDASGTFTQTEITSLDVWPAGPNIILEQTSKGLVIGTLDGSYEDVLRVVIHPNGKFNAKFTIICECTVDGKEGVLQLEATDTGELVSQTLATFAGRAVITGGTDELFNLRGVLEIAGTVDVVSGLSTYDYMGRIH